MKKISILIVGLTMLLGVSAQDTIVSQRLKSAYFYNGLADNNEYEHALVTPGGADSNDFPYKAKNFFTTDSLTVYGIAVGYVFVRDELSFGGFYDTTWDNAYEYFSLYRDAVGVDSLVCFSDSLKIHARYTPIAYFQNFEESGPYRNYYPAFYEKLFDSAYHVQGRFYIAKTNRSWTKSYYDSVTDETYSHEKRPVWVGEFAILNRKTGELILDTIVLKVHFKGGWDPIFQEVLPDTMEWRRCYDDHLLMFPIVDTSSNEWHAPDTNATAVSEVSAADRFVALSPNPTKGRVRVVATCGMSRLTVYSPTGEAVLEKEVSGTETVLDIAGWAAGSYLLRVATPLGTTTKKLLVR